MKKLRFMVRAVSASPQQHQICRLHSVRMVLRFARSAAMKNDSTRLLLGRICSQTVLDMVRDNDEVAAEDIVHTGYNGIKCVEAGGPEPGVGCAGRGIIVALEKLVFAGGADGRCI